MSHYQTELRHEKALKREAQERQRISSSAPELAQYTESVESAEGEEKQYDVFIAHASEDKVGFTNHLARVLRGMGLEVWYDDFVLEYGLSLRRQIDKGITNSRRGVVVISHAFFTKEWPQAELDGMMSYQMEDGKPFIFPIWYDIGAEDVRRHSPTLASLVALRTSTMDVEQVAATVARSVPGFDADKAEQVEIAVNSSAFSDEERTLLAGLLNLNRRIFKYWYNVSHNYWHTGASAWDETVDPDDAISNAENARDYQELVNARDEVEAFVSDGLLELAESFAERVQNCQRRLLYEVGRHSISEPKQQGPLWREVQVGIRDAFVSQGTEAAYLDLRERVRDELKR